MPNFDEGRLERLVNQELSFQVFSANTRALSGPVVIGKDRLFFPRDVVVQNKDLKAYLENGTYRKKTYDYKTLYSVLKRAGIAIVGVSFDLLLAAYLLNPAYAADDFKKTVDNFHPSAIPYYDNVYGANTKMKIPDIEVYARYSADKCELIRELEAEMIAEMEKRELEGLFKIELELSEVLAEMELSVYWSIYTGSRKPDASSPGRRTRAPKRCMPKPASGSTLTRRNNWARSCSKNCGCRTENA